MIQMQYKSQESLSGKWYIYAQYHRVTKDMREFAKDQKRAEFPCDVRYVDTKKNPEMAL